jgi:hypothetical protein
VGWVSFGAATKELRQLERLEAFVLPRFPLGKILRYSGTPRIAGSGRARFSGLVLPKNHESCTSLINKPLASITLDQDPEQCESPYGSTIETFPLGDFVNRLLPVF